MEQKIDKTNVGRIAERIVANELEARGFRVSDLNRDGLAANADLLAAGHNVVKQIQVKGATNAPSDRLWWWQYGYCTDPVIDNKIPMFNRTSSFYTADFVVLVAVRSQIEYQCIVLPVDEAEKAAQVNLDRAYRTLTIRGAQKKKPGKVWIRLDPAPLENKQSNAVLEHLSRERKILGTYKNNWDALLTE